jgi:hypothetical protein
MPPELLQPWNGFVTDLDGMIAADVALHCLGGFVVTVCYGLPRPTGDLDILLVLPSESQATLVALAGRNSDLHQKHGGREKAIRSSSQKCRPGKVAEFTADLPGANQRNARDLAIRHAQANHTN